MSKRTFNWVEMATGYLLLFMYCVAVLAGFAVNWLFSLPARAVRGGRR